MVQKYTIVQDNSGKTGYQPRGAAREFWRYKGAECLISGAAETGKTRACAEKLDALLWKYAGTQAVIVRKVRATMAGSVLATYRKVLGEGTPVKAHGGDAATWYDYPNGSRLWVAGMDDPQKVLSSERDFVYVNQAEELSLDDWQTLCTRATGRAGNTPYAQVMGDCNPGAPWHWIKERAASGQLKLFESRHEDNPTLFTADGILTEQGKRTMAVLDALTGVRKERLRFGRWVSAEGTVYTLDASVHVVPWSKVLPPKFCIASVDWGLRNPGTIQVWQVDGDGRMYLVREVYRTGKLIDWWVEQGRECKRLYNVDTFVCDPSEPAYIEQFVRGGLNAVGAENSILPGIQAVEARLAVQPDGRPRLMLVEGCLTERDESLAEARKPTCLREEFDVYVYSKDAGGRAMKEAPVKENDHGCDAMRYSVVAVDLRTRVSAGKIGFSAKPSPFHRQGSPFSGTGFKGKPKGGW